MLRARYEAEIIGSAPLPLSMEELQAIANRLTHNHNEGIREDDAAIAEDLGVDPAVLDAVRRQLEKSLSRIAESSGGVPGADRFGLSPNAFTQLTRGEVPNVPGVLRLREPSELHSAGGLVASAPCQRGVRWLLDRAMSEEGLAATQAGYVSPSVVTGICSSRPSAASTGRLAVDSTHRRSSTGWRDSSSTPPASRTILTGCP